MAEKTKGDVHKTETPDVSHIRNVEVEHETSDINVRAVVTFAVVLAISIAVVAFGLTFLFDFLGKREAKSSPKPGPMALKKDDKKRLPPEPRLQGSKGFGITLENGEIKDLELTAPQSEYGVLRQHWEENLRTGLKDQSGNVVGMPIDAAIDKIVSEGLGSKAKQPNGKIEDYAIKMPTASSSGRETEKRLQ